MGIPLGKAARIAGLLLLVAGLVAGCAPEAPAPVVAGAARYDGPAAGRVTVAGGDTVYSLSRRHGVPIRALIDANRLTPPYTLRPGQVLVVPKVRVHVVERGDTLYGLARRYGVSMVELAQVNGIRPPYIIRIGQRLSLPATSAAAAAAPAASPRQAAPPPAAPSQSVMIIQSPNADAAPAPDPAPSAAAPAARPQAPPPPRPATVVTVPPQHQGGFAWPVRGRVLAKFGPTGKGQHNDGINIAVPRGTPVRASADGVVVYAGNELKGFGNMLLVKHGGGWMTAYAHNDRLLVSRGASVRRGQVIARAGSTGNVATPQLHFELRKGTRAVDPMEHLADLRAAAE